MRFSRRSYRTKERRNRVTASRMEREESKVRLPLWCRAHTDCRRYSWGH